MRTEAAIVVGASGFIGRHVVDALAGVVPKVYAITGRTPSVPGATLTLPFEAIDDLPPLPSETVLVNVAATRYDARSFRSQQAEIVRVNMDIINRAYGFCVARGIREVRYASSSAVYPASWALQDDERPLPLDDWPHDGEAAYAWSKRWGEIAAECFRRTHAIATLSFRLTNPFGPYDTCDVGAAHVATAFVLKALQPGETLEVLGNPSAERDFVYAGDIAAVLRATLDERGRTEALNIARGETATILAFAEAVLRAAGSTKRIVVAGQPTSGVNVRRAAGARLHRLFPAAPQLRTLDAALSETLAWYRNALARH